MPESSRAVFLSYASQDAAPAQRICDALRAGGIEVWFDQAELRGGDAWDQTIRKQIKTCALFVPVISHATHDRVEGYFRLEWKLGIDRSHLISADQPFLLPIVIDDTPGDDDRVPERFREVQWTPLPGGVASAAFVEHVARLLSGEPVAKPAGTRAPPGAHGIAVPPVRRSLVNSRVAQVITVALVLAAGYFAIEKAGVLKAIVAGGSTQPIAGHDAASVPEKSIAVLPFVDMSQGQDQQYLSDGISEELMNLLGQVPHLRVIARASSFSFRGKDIDVTEIARRLNVSNVLEGSVRKSGNTVRITVQLIRASDSAELWSETYDRSLDDIFKVQDEIAAAVVRKLRITLLGAAPTSKVIDPKAFQLILQAKFFTDLRTAASRAQALVLYQEALAIEPNDAPAWDGMARVYTNQALYKERPIAEGFRLAREAANKALASDPLYAPAHARLGRIASEFDGDLATAAQHFQRALDLDPSNLTVVGNTEVFLLNLGRMEEAIALDRYMVSHDPANPANFGALGDDYRYAGRWDEAISSYRSALSLSPGYKFAHLNIANSLLLGKNDPAGAMKEILNEPDESARLQGTALASYSLGRRREADEALAQLTTKYESQASYNIAAAFAFRGEADRAFEWLNKSVAYQDTGLAAIFHEPLFGRIHSDPRWLPLLRKLGKTPEQLAAIELKVPMPK